LLNPYQAAAHGRLCRCAPTSTRLLSRAKRSGFAINGSFRSGVPLDCSGKPGVESVFSPFRRRSEGWFESNSEQMSGQGQATM
jgi:hypothetical protein